VWRTSGNHGNHREIRRSLEKIESWQRTRSPNGGRQTSFASRISDDETGVAQYQISNDWTRHVVKLPDDGMRFGDKQVLDDVQLVVGIAVHPVFFLVALLIAIAALIEGVINAAAELTHRHP
jgi:hypothetical protein